MGNNIPLPRLHECACYYAKEGIDLKVFPVKPRDKTPITKNGFKDASKDLDQIDAWWEQTPDANIGLPCEPNGLLVIDIDRHVNKATGEIEDGIAAFEELCGGDWPLTPTSITGGGGRHLFFKYPDYQFDNRSRWPGIDVKDHGYVVVPPSIHTEGGEYRWKKGLGIHELPLAEVPLWLEKIIRVEPIDNTETPPAARPYTPPSSGDRLSDIEVAKEALNLIPSGYADVYTDWIAVGMALHATDESLLPAWEAWSRQSSKFKEGVCAKKWASFKAEREGGVTTAFLVDLARETEPNFIRKGWRRETFPQESPASAPAPASSPDPAPAPRPVLRDTDDDAPRATTAGNLAVDSDPELQNLPHVKPGPDFPPTDIGNAKRFVALYGDQLRWCEDWKCWLWWDSRRWLRNSDLQALRFAKLTAEGIANEAAEAIIGKEKLTLHWKASCGATRIEAILKLAKPDLCVTSNQLDQNLWHFNCLNGTIDLKTGELLSHNPEDLNSNLCPFNYVPEAYMAETEGSKLWSKFLGDVTNGDDELVAFHQRFYGYALCGTPQEHVIGFNYGTGGTGKTTFIETILHVLGPDYATTINIETILRRPPSADENTPALARLQGKRLVACSETNDGRALNTGLVKSLTGGEQISTTAKYESPVSWIPQFTVVMASNFRPKIPHDDEGMWRRWRTIPFDHKFLNPDNPSTPADQRADITFKDRLKALAGEAVLSWVVEGCLIWQKQGIGTCRAVEQASESYKADMDPLASWLEECVILSNEDDAWTATQDLYEDYHYFVKEAGEHNVLSLKDFGKALKGMDGLSPMKKRMGSSRPCGYKGILLRKEPSGPSFG
jgi:putative DNA primase/helicase